MRILSYRFGSMIFSELLPFEDFFIIYTDLFVSPQSLSNDRMDYIETLGELSVSRGDAHIVLPFRFDDF